MNIEWLNKEQKESAITIHNNNITLSKNASSLFDNAYGVLVGINKDTNELIIKKVSHEQIFNKEFNKEDVYTLTFKPSYGRINSKQLVDNISKHYGLNFDKKQAYKYNAKWNNGLNMLIVKMGGE